MQKKPTGDLHNDRCINNDSHSIINGNALMKHDVGTVFGM